MFVEPSRTSPMLIIPVFRARDDHADRDMKSPRRSRTEPLVLLSLKPCQSDPNIAPSSNV